MKDIIFKRLREPSTWRGIAVLLTLAGLQIAPESVDAIGQGFIALMGILAMFTPEKTQH
jgi:hypothetical protein